MNDAKAVDEERRQLDVMPEIEWCRDPAASGWRSRAWLGEFELIAYDDGDWELRGPPIGHAIDGGTAADGEAAKLAALTARNSRAG